MLRHRRQRWAAMDFLLASYRKQKKWIRFRQLLLLLSRLAVATLLIALLCGWTGGKQLLGVLGGQTTHHVVILDDSYSMGDDSTVSGSDASTAYARALRSLQTLTQRLAGDDGNHQLTVMRASRASIAVRGGSESGDAAADLSAQTISADGRLISRVMATSVSSIRTDLISALDLAGQLINSTPADANYLYVASDFRSSDWGSPERVAESMRAFANEKLEIRMIDCAAKSSPNLAITDVSPVQDVWVANVPVFIRATVKNYSLSEAKNIAVSCRVIRYGSDVQQINPTQQVSGNIDALPALMIESLAPGAEVTKTFQVYIPQTGTHAIEVSLPADSLAIDNTRVCTLPLSDASKVLVVDSDPDAMGAYYIGSVLNPGSQVRIGAIPEIQPPSFLRSITYEDLTRYRAVYLVDLPEITDSAADALQSYVENGGGVAWFLGGNVVADSYNKTLLVRNRQLLPGALDKAIPLPPSDSDKTGDVVFGENGTLVDPLRGGGDVALSRIGLAQSWTLVESDPQDELASDSPGEGNDAENKIRVRTVLSRRDAMPLVTQHNVGLGRVVTALTGVDGSWTNWTSDGTFVPFLLLTNASLWSGAAPPTQRRVDDSLDRVLVTDDFFPEIKLAPAANVPPRVPIEAVATEDAGEGRIAIRFQPAERLLSGETDVDELLRPGVFEWELQRSDGAREVIPVASVIEIGEGDLKRADQAQIVQGLLPIEVQFLSSETYNEETRVAGSSTITLVLLALLGLILAAEQMLAYWASYHLAPTMKAGSLHGGLQSE